MITHEKILQSVGLKVTSPRLKILNLLHQRGAHHWSAEAAHQCLVEQGEDIGIATVYRVLTQFELAGLVKRHAFEGGHSVFEWSQTEHHDHLVCVECGRVEEFIDPIIEAQQLAVAAQFRFHMTDHRLIIYGRCELCSVQESGVRN